MAKVPLLLATKRYGHIKTTSITLGLIIFILSIVAIIWTKLDNQYEIFGIIIGLLVFLNGLCDLPKGVMKIENNFLSVSGLKNKIDIRQIKGIKIYKERMILTNIDNKTERVDNLAISQESAQLIESYISEKGNNIDLTIILTNFDKE